MLKSFEQHLGKMSRIAVGKSNPENDEKTRERLEALLDFQVFVGAEENRTSEKTQHTIFKLQKRKQKIMDKLKTQLSNIDNPFANEVQEIGTRTIRCIEGKYFYRDDTQVREVTMGELMTDGEWGLQYHLDPNSVPRNIRKKYFIEQARRELMDLLNRQIVTNESQSEFVDAKKSEGYIKMIAQENQEQSGKYAERMVKNLIKKIAIDQDLDIDIAEGDAYQDMELKIDFIISRKSAARGVKVDTHDEERIGVQFTSTDSREILEKKEKQVQTAKTKLKPQEKIQDIALISIPLFQIQKLIRDWNKNRKPGGPEKLWSAEIKADIFQKMMRNFLTEEEIKQCVAKIQPKPLRAAA